MKLLQGILISTAIISISILPASVLANPSEDFYKKEGQVFDQWDVCRTRGIGQDGFFQIIETGFRPVIVFESLGEGVDQAYQLGQEFARTYPDLNQRAEKIFAFVRNKIRYYPDIDQFGFKEYAQNADELAATIKQKGITYGDCEDYAVFLAVMYRGAGHRSAIVLVPGHAAALVYLPEYKKANQVLTIDVESGWIWAEATGGNNRLGWMPEKCMGKPLAAYEVTDEAITLSEPPNKLPTTVTQKSGGTGFRFSPFFGVIILMWLLPLFRRRH